MTSQRGRVSQARALVETAAPLAEMVPSLRLHVETIRRFGEGEFVSKGDLLKAAQGILDALPSKRGRADPE